MRGGRRATKASRLVRDRPAFHTTPRTDLIPDHDEAREQPHRIRSDPPTTYPIPGRSPRRLQGASTHWLEIVYDDDGKPVIDEPNQTIVTRAREKSTDASSTPPGWDEAGVWDAHGWVQPPLIPLSGTASPAAARPSATPPRRARVSRRHAPRATAPVPEGVHVAPADNPHPTPTFAPPAPSECATTSSPSLNGGPNLRTPSNGAKPQRRTDPTPTQRHRPRRRRRQRHRPHHQRTSHPRHAESRQHRPVLHPHSPRRS